MRPSTREPTKNTLPRPAVIPSGWKPSGSETTSGNIGRAVAGGERNSDPTTVAAAAAAVATERGVRRIGWTSWAVPVGTVAGTVEAVGGREEPTVGSRFPPRGRTNNPNTCGL